MPEKSVREMNKLERMHFSLQTKVFHATLMGALILGLTAMLIGLGFYTYALARQYIAESFSLSRSAAAIVSEVADVESFADGVMTIYRAQSEAELAECGTEAYRARFSQMKEDETYEAVRAILGDLAASSDVSAVYLAMYDPDTCAMVYLIDPSLEDTLMPGEWEPVTEEGMNKFLHWDGTGMLYDIDRTERYGYLCTSGVPIRDADGRIMAFALADISLANVRHGMRYFVLQFTLALAVLTLLVAFFLTRHMKKRVVNPINEITRAAENYVQDRSRGEGNTEHFALLNIRTGDEIENLSLVMADMERDLNAYVEDLTRITAEKERINTELSLATRIQADMMPHIFPPFPDRTEFDIYATMDPAREVGGDFYDYFLIDNDHLCLVMADVSGKGVPAALFMMASKIILASCAMLGGTPGEILTKTNEAICSNNREEMFVTVWLGILEISTGKLTTANAGHEYPVIRYPNGDFAIVRDKHGLVIGGMAGVRYKETELRLEPGAKLFVYTDGVPEATDADKKMFGMERMLAALNRARDADPAQTLRCVRGAVDDFVKDAEQFDDLTMLCLEYYGTKEERENNEQ